MDLDREHRAYHRRKEHDELGEGAWTAGCDYCGTKFFTYNPQHAQWWATGHDSAVAQQRHVARTAAAFFVRTGPGDAITLGVLRDRIDEVIATRGGDVEIVQPADQAPLLYLWTPPTEEGWHRDSVGVLALDRVAS